MEIYELAAPEGFQWLLPRKPEALLDLWPVIQDRSLKDSWVPLSCEPMEDAGDGKPRRRSDFPHMTHGVMVVSERAAQSLSEPLNQHGELLPLNCAGEIYWLFNSLTMLDALDMEQSVVFRLDTGRIIDVEQPIFVEDIVADNSIFHLPLPHPSKIYFTAAFVDLVEDAGLVGLGALSVYP